MLSTENSKKDSIKIQFTADEMGLDDFEFRPMTKGLGFHNEKKKSLNRPKVINPEVPAFRPVHTTSIEKSKESLQSFYQEERSTLKQEAPKIQADGDKKYYVRQAVAWFADCFIITLLMGVTFLLFTKVSGISFRILPQLLTVEELALFGGALFSIFYFCYFTVLDLTGSPGKLFLGLELKSTLGTAIELKQTFTRTITTYTSFFTMFLPLLLDFQGKLSDTTIIKR